MKTIFSKTAKKQFENWLATNKNVSLKIEELITDIHKNGFLTGKGKPEQLKYYKNPVRFSRHITKTDRLVYVFTEENDLLIVSCKGHYFDR